MVRSYTIDESLVAQAVKASGNRPVEQVLTEALREYAQRRHTYQDQVSPDDRNAQIKAWLTEAVNATADTDPRDLIAQFGTIDYLPDFDPQTERKRQAAEYHKRLDEIDSSEASK